MENIPTKVDGVDVLPADQWNQVPSEIENTILSTGITLSSGDLFQLGKAISDYAAHGNFYTDSGATNAYVVSVLGSKQAPTTYADGMRVRFLPGNDNTGASTINVAGLGVKNIKTPQGNDPVAGVIDAGLSITLEYDNANGYFIIYNVAIGGANEVGKLVQEVNVQDGAVATGTTTTPFDNTTPQNTEGDEYMTLAITPTNASDILEIEIVAILSHSNNGNDHFTGALFQDSTANALAAAPLNTDVADVADPLILKHRMVAGTTSLTTFKFRAGANLAGTSTLNGVGGVGIYNNLCASSMTIKQIKA